MVAAPIPRWLAKLDERKPYIEVLDGEKQPDVSPQWPHGQLAVRIGSQLDMWAGDRGATGAEVRFYFQRPGGTWSSVLPDICYTSFARVPREPRQAWTRPRIAPDLAVEIWSPNDRPGRMKRKIELYLEFGALVVLVLHPTKRRARLYRADRSVEERAAGGSWSLEPFDGLVLDWDWIYRGMGID